MFDMKWFHEASSVDDAIEWLKKDEDAEIISGGTDVLIWMREGKYAGKALVSIHNIPELKGISLEQNGDIVIRPATNFYNITHNDIIQKYMKSLGEAVDMVGGPQTRWAGTIGGNICNGATSAESASTMSAFDANIELKGPNGRRVVPISNWYLGPGKTVKDRCEVVTKFIIPKSNYENFYGYYIKYGKRKAMEITTLGCSCLVKLDDKKTKIEDIKLAYGVANPIPKRVVEGENFAKGKMLKDIDEQFLKEYSEAALSGTNPRDSWRASKDFRIQLIKELAIRTLKESISRAGGKING